MQKILKYIILIGIFLLPLINSIITNLLWFSFSIPVDWNYEFTKVMFFNIWSSLVISLFFINNIFSRVWKFSYPTVGLFIFYTIILLSTIFSESPIISFLWNNEKSHSFLMWSNLVWLYIVFSSLLSPLGGKYPKGDRGLISFTSIIKTFIFSGIFVSIIWLKEYFYPTFNYWDLWNRLFSTFWHPNYLSIFLVALMPFFSSHLTSPKRRGIKGIIFILFIITLFFTKSFIAIFLFIIFIILKSAGQQRALALWIVSFIVFFWFVVIYNFLPEKLHSFISRYFIWETTLRIIFSDIKLFLIGWWAETLTYFFNNFKSEYIYIFENLGYTADRPHNILLNFFYHFWIFGLVFILWVYYKIFNYKVGNKNFYSLQILQSKISLILIFIFILFNPTNIVIYLFCIILLAKLYLQNKNETVGSAGLQTLQNIFIIFITLISIFWAYNSLKFYISETYSYKNNYAKSLNIYKNNPELYFQKWDFENWLKITKRKTVLFYKYTILFINNLDEKIILSDNFLGEYNYAENYFYIWNVFWDLWKKDIAKEYYEKWLEKLPDLWNSDSKYYKEFLIKRLKIDDHRITSEKYWLKTILERLK